MVTLEIDNSRLNSRIEELYDALIGAGQMGDAATIVEDEARLANKQIINLTPPKGIGQAARKEGEESVRRDLNKIFTPVNEELLNTIGSQFGTTGIDTWFTTKSGKKEHVQWDRLDPSGAGMLDFHNLNRDSRGRARSLKKKKFAWYSPYAVSFQDFNTYLKRVQSHVGRRKAAWGVSFQALGGTLPDWIRRHVSGAKGRCLNNLFDPLNPSVEMANGAPGIQGDYHILNSALRIRRSAIARRIRLVLSGYSRDVKVGIAIQKQERRKGSDSL